MWQLDKDNKITLDAETRVIKSADFQSLIQGKQIINEAEKESKRIIAEAKKKAEKIVEDAKDAYEEERKKGFAQGCEEGKDQMAELMAKMTIKDTSSFASFQDRMVNLVTRAVKRVLGEVDQQELIGHIVTNALQVIRNQKQAVLKVHPSQVSKVRSSVAEFLKDHSTVEFIDVVADPRLKPNSCLMETEMGIMDASLDVQVEAIRKALEKTVNN